MVKIIPILILVCSARIQRECLTKVCLCTFTLFFISIINEILHIEVNRNRSILICYSVINDLISRNSFAGLIRSITCDTLCFRICIAVIIVGNCIRIS